MVGSSVLGRGILPSMFDIVPTLAHKLLIGLARRIHEVDGQKVN